jgi:hypothetical protein
MNKKIKMMKFFIILMFFISFFNKSCSFSYMVPQESCYNLNPLHNNTTQQKNESPFRIYHSQTYFQHDDEIKGINIFQNYYEYYVS